MSTDIPQITYLKMIEKLQAEPHLTAAQRTSMISAIRRFVRCFEPRGLEAPVRPKEIGEILKRATALKAGIGERSFSNMISLLRRALRLCSVIQPAFRRGRSLSPCWGALLPPANTPARWRISRFLHIASEHSWEPTAITAEHFRVFHTLVEESAIVPNPRQVVRNAVWQWNQLAQSVEGINAVEYHMPHSLPRFSLRWEKYPSSLQQELNAFFEEISNPPFLSDEDRRPLRPATIVTMNWRLRLFAGALVGSGWNPASITSLSQLCTLSAFKTGLRFLRDRAGRTIPQVLGVADAVHSLAIRHPSTNPTELATMKKHLGKLRKELRQTGLSARNRNKLIQFDIPAKRDALLTLPQRLHRLAKAERASGHYSRPRAASLMLAAVAIEVLLMCPMRLANLASLDLEKHIRRTATTKTISVHLHVPENEVKNGVAIDCELPEESARLLEEYINDFRPDVPHQPSTLLFPAMNGGPRGHNVFWRALTKIVRRYAGVEINPHLFRHLAAKFHLDEHPGAYETVRRTLGHKSMNTTVQFYAGLETSQTFRHFDQTILRRRQQATERSKYKPRRAG